MDAFYYEYASNPEALNEVYEATIDQQNRKLDDMEEKLEYEKDINKQLQHRVSEMGLREKSDKHQIKILRKQNEAYESYIEQLKDRIWKLESQVETSCQTTDEESSYSPQEPSRKRSWDSKSYTPGHGLSYKPTIGKVRLIVGGSTPKRQRRESSLSSVEHSDEEIVDESDVEGEEIEELDPFEDAVDR